MHEWLSGGASPCQGEGRGFESRLVLAKDSWLSRVFFVAENIVFPHPGSLHCKQYPHMIKWKIINL